MSETTQDTVTCLYPGCERPAVPPPKHGGPPPRYCDIEEHNANTTFQAMKKQQEEGGEA